MATTALVRVVDTEPAAGGDGFLFRLQSFLSGPGVPPATTSVVDVTILSGDNPAAMRNKIAGAVAADWTAQGFQIQPTDVILPSWDKGA